MINPLFTDGLASEKEGTIGTGIVEREVLAKRK